MAGPGRPGQQHDDIASTSEFSDEAPGDYSGDEEPDADLHRDLLGCKGNDRRDALSILLRLADAMEGNTADDDLGDDFNDAADTHLLPTRGKGQVDTYDMLDSYPASYKPKGSIRRPIVKKVDEEETDDEDGGPREWRTAPFFADRDVEASPRKGAEAAAAVLPSAVPRGDPGFRFYQRQRRLNWPGCAVVALYCLALVFYVYVRVTRTLSLGRFTGYGVFVLLVEMAGATSTLLYGVNLLFHPVNPPPPTEDGTLTGRPRVGAPYHVRVLVPCYKESLDIVAKTLEAALAAELPAGCGRTVYLLDDGKQRDKRKWCEARAGGGLVYLAGRQRAGKEMNGKSANLNNCLRQLYPGDHAVPAAEIVCVFDADQVARADFFLKMLPCLDGGDDVGMVLSPQSFSNLRPHADIFNHGNVQFWEYAQHGYDAIGFISCTGTNFLIRSAAFKEAGWSPEYTLTEDFALGMELKKRRWQCRYVEEYLAVGEAPDEVRNCFQQRSRWAKGHWQMILSRHCPLVQRELSAFQRVLYCSGVWNYLVGGFTTPLFIILPIITIFGGIFPIVISWWAAVALTIYTVAQTLVLNNVRTLRHVEPLWFANIANNILWFTFIKAGFRSALALVGNGITFKTTLKGMSKLNNAALGDLWIPVASLIALGVALGIGCRDLVRGPSVITTLAISVAWIVYSMIPPLLLLWYTFIGRGTTLKLLCRLMFVASYVSSIGALVLLWLVYPKDYDFGSAARASLQFYAAQRVGALPADNAIPWRGSALLYEASPEFGFRDLTGGYLNGGVGGDLKLTMPAAWSTALLAWGVLAFPQGWARAGGTADALGAVRWGTDYLLKTFHPYSGAAGGYTIVHQVGNLTEDVHWWGRPEAMTAEANPRPAYFAYTAEGASDLAGQLAGALAASSLAIGSYGRDPGDAEYAARLLRSARDLYSAANAHPGSFAARYHYQCTSRFNRARLGARNVARLAANATCVPPAQFARGAALVFYNSTSYRDDLLWAAAWLYRATREPGYLTDVTRHYALHLEQEAATDAELVTDWNHAFWAANVLLANATDQGAFHAATQSMLKQWVCATSGRVRFTPRGRAWNAAAPELGATGGTALLALMYGQAPSRYLPPAMADRFTCFARSQLRYVLGDSGRSLMAGWGARPPTAVQNRAASCPDPPANCSRANLLAPGGNPHTLTGAVVAFGSFSDTLNDVRTANDTRVSIDNNAPFAAALAGLNSATGTWSQCLQGFGVFMHDTALCDAALLQ